jgi:predicted O-methyltransferase YrrM
VFLAVLCEERQPHQVLDLGSGFSSYVFRWGAQPTRRVCSVDVSSRWLERTARFLQEHQIERAELLDLRSFAAADRREQFDLVFHDIAELSDRIDMLEAVMQLCRPGGLLVLDDMHVPRYRAAVLQALRAASFELYSLRPRTRQSWRLRYAYLAVRP